MKYSSTRVLDLSIVNRYIFGLVLHFGYSWMMEVDRILFFNYQRVDQSIVQSLGPTDRDGTPIDPFPFREETRGRVMAGTSDELNEQSFSWYY